MAKGTTEAITSEDKGTIIVTKGIALRQTSKETWLLLETHQTPAFNAEKKGTMPETAQNTAQTVNTTERPTSSISTTIKTMLTLTSSRKIR